MHDSDAPPPAAPVADSGAVAQGASGRRRIRWLWGALSLGTVVVLAWSLLSPASPTPTPTHTSAPLPAAPLVGHLAPEVTVLDLSNNAVSLSSLRGKIVLLNFWYVACEPCRYEMPLL